MGNPDRLTQLLTFYRHSQGLSQQEGATIGKISATDLSKIERGVKKRVHVDVLLRLIQGYKLNSKQGRELLEVAGYSPSLLDRVRFSPQNYPIASGNIDRRLQGSHGFWPVWKLDTDGNVSAANLLAFRLWKALEETEAEIDPDRLLGENIFSVYLRNLNRIAMPEDESSFWYVTLAVWRKLKDTIPDFIVTEFEKAIAAHPILKLILQYGAIDIEREWEYYLRIIPSVAPLTAGEPKDYLEFKILFERIINTRQELEGYLVTAQPLGTFTIERIQREYTRLIDVFGPAAFVQEEEDIAQEELEAEERFPSFFPAIHLDEVGNIILENMAFILLFDPTYNQADQKHYFDWLLSPQMETLMNGLDLTIMRIPVIRFLERTKTFEQDYHPHHHAYQTAKAHLISQKRFAAVLSELSRAQRTHGSINLNTTTFPLDIACPFPGTDFRLSFDVVERLPMKIIKDYRVSFVPRNTATTAALILLRMLHEHEYQEARTWPEQQQLAYGVAVLKTLLEGFTKKKGKRDWGWHPEGFVRETVRELTTVPHAGEHIQEQLRWVISQVLLSDTERQEALISMLRAFFEPLEHVRAFFADAPQADTLRSIDVKSVS